MKITTANLIRWAGLSAIASGTLFILIQLIHPLDQLSFVTTTRWAVVHYIGIFMAIFGLFGILGIYARQVEKAGWLGLIGYLLMSLFYMLSLAFQFVEAFISPILATAAPQFVEGFLGIASGHPTGTDMGALPLVYTLTGLAGYLLGGLTLGIATYRAAILPRWAGALLAFSVALPLLTAPLLSHPYDRILAVPLAIALIWLGYALWSERQTAQDPAPAPATPQLSQAVK